VRSVERLFTHRDRKNTYARVLESYIYTHNVFRLKIQMTYIWLTDIVYDRRANYETGKESRRGKRKTIGS
jgi:hypothetical protein